jgi:FkbM family methyltransferase
VSLVDAHAVGDAIARQILPATRQMMLSKIVQIGGRDTRVFGDATDAYFAGIEGHLAASAPLQRALAALPQGSVIVDIGANVGAMAAMAARLSKASAIYCIEPSPRAFACLEAMVEANGFDQCRCIPSAVGSSAGTTFLAEYDTIAYSHVSDEGTKVPMQTLDGLVAELGLERIDLIKLDVEGYELEVLKGGHSAIRRLDPCVFMELNSYTLSVFGNVSPKALVDFILSEFGVIHARRDGTPFVVHDRDTTQRLILTNMTALGSVEDVTFGGRLPHEAIHTDPRPTPAPGRKAAERVSNNALRSLAGRLLAPLRPRR